MQSTSNLVSRPTVSFAIWRMTTVVAVFLLNVANKHGYKQSLNSYKQTCIVTDTGDHKQATINNTLPADAGRGSQVQNYSRSDIWSPPRRNFVANFSCPALDLQATCDWPLTWVNRLLYTVFQKRSPPPKTFWNIFTSVKSFYVNFRKFLANSYSRIKPFFVDLS